jgi:hypothetical protein
MMKLCQDAKSYIHPAFDIPIASQATLFPNALLSVLEFLQFPLPVIAGTAMQHSPLSFFSRDEPTVHDTNA